MNIDNIHDALNYLDDDMIEAVDNLRKEKSQYKTSQKVAWVRWASVAACFCLIAASVYATAELELLQLGGPRKDAVKNESADGSWDEVGGSDMEAPDMENNMDNESDGAPDNNTGTNSNVEATVLQLEIKITEWKEDGFEGVVVISEDEKFLKLGQQVFVKCDNFVTSQAEFPKGSVVAVTGRKSIGESQDGTVTFYAVDIGNILSNKQGE